MKKSLSPRRERGAALLAALMFSGMTAMVVGAGLWVSSSHYDLAMSQARSESALLLAEGGVNDELAKLAENPGMPVPSDPTVGTGETMKFPGESHAVYGRKGSIASSDETYWVCTSANEWWRSGSTPQAWDGVADTFWVTASAYVRGSWRRTEVQVSKQSLFGQYAVYTNSGDDNDCSNSGVDLDTTADVTITGTAGTNGRVSCHTGCKLSTGNCLNANKGHCSSTQFPTSCVRTGSSICDRTTPYAYPTCTSVMKKSCGLSSYTDSGAWTWMKNNCDNATGIYTYKSTASSSTISRTNCSRSTYTGTTCCNYSAYSSSSKGCWDYAKAKPGTSSRVKTMIFEPGDYYFSSLQLPYDSSTEIVIDPQALASGGTPGQVRFWINDTSWYASDDNVDLPMQMTTTTGGSVDPSLFRIYYAKDGHCLTFNRPSGCRDYRGYSVTGDFNVCGGVYAVTRPSNASGCSTTQGAQVKLCGSSGTTGGKSCFTGSLMCDRVSFSGGCRVDWSACSHQNDPPCGAKLCGGYCDRK